MHVSRSIEDIIGLKTYLFYYVAHCIGKLLQVMGVWGIMVVAGILVNLCVFSVWKPSVPRRQDVRVFNV